jgi:hypothetical protein
MLTKLRLLYDFLFFLIYYKDRKKAWESAKTINIEVDDVCESPPDVYADGFLDYEEIIAEAWDEFSDSHWIPPTNPEGPLLSDQLWGLRPMEHSRESFELESRRNPDFAIKWDLVFEEWILSDVERIELMRNRISLKKNIEVIRKREPSEDFSVEEFLKPYGVPKKAIIVTHKNNWSVTYE